MVIFALLSLSFALFCVYYLRCSVVSLSRLCWPLGSLLGGGASGLRAKIQDTTVVYFLAREDRQACLVWFGFVLGLVWFGLVWFGFVSCFPAMSAPVGSAAGFWAGE
jgi:hypothetical protein